MVLSRKPHYGTTSNVELQEYFPKKSGIIERKLVAPLDIAGIIGAGADLVNAGVPVAIANLITGETAAHGSADGAQRGSLVVSFANSIFHEIQYYAPESPACRCGFCIHPS